LVWIRLPAFPASGAAAGRCGELRTLGRAAWWPGGREVRRASDLWVGGATAGFPEQASCVARRLAPQTLAAGNERVLPPGARLWRRAPRVPALPFLFFLLFFGCKSFYKYFSLFLVLYVKIFSSIFLKTFSSNFFLIKIFSFSHRNIFLEKVSH
jgi:hypothetical protein